MGILNYVPKPYRISKLYDFYSSKFNCDIISADISLAVFLNSIKFRRVVQNDYKYGIYVCRYILCVCVCVCVCARAYVRACVYTYIYIYIYIISNLH